MRNERNNDHKLFEQIWYGMLVVLLSVACPMLILALLYWLWRLMIHD